MEFDSMDGVDLVSPWMEIFARCRHGSKNQGMN